jgi:cytidine deaminase
MRLDVRCAAAPYENTTCEEESAIDLAYSLSEEYQCDVTLVYNHTGTVHSVVSNY